MQSTSLTVADLKKFCDENGLSVTIYDYAEADGQRATARQTPEHFVLGAEISEGSVITYQLEVLDKSPGRWGLYSFISGRLAAKMFSENPCFLLKMILNDNY